MIYLSPLQSRNYLYIDDYRYYYRINPMDFQQTKFSIGDSINKIVCVSYVGEYVVVKKSAGREIAGNM